MVLNTKATSMILSLSFTFQLAASILKLICSRKLKDKNMIEYCNITHDCKNLSQNKIVLIICQNTRKSIEKLIEKLKKFFVKIDFICFILWCSSFAIISENTGNKNQKIGHIIIKGIEIILK